MLLEGELAIVSWWLRAPIRYRWPYRCSLSMFDSADAKFTGCSRIRSKVIRDELFWDKAIVLQQLAHELQRGALVPPAVDQHIEDLALGIDGAPQIDHAAVDFQVHLIQMPSRMGLGSAFAQVCCDHRSEMVHPASNGLVGDHDPAFRQQILDVA